MNTAGIYIFQNVIIVNVNFSSHEGDTAYIALDRDLQMQYVRILEKSIQKLKVQNVTCVTVHAKLMLTLTSSYPLSRSLSVYRSIKMDMLHPACFEFDGWLIITF